MNYYSVLGLMSGTSLDGLDIAQCTFEFREGKWNYEIERAMTYPYSQAWKDKLTDAEKLSGLDLMLLHNEYASLTANYVNLFLEGQKPAIDFIASHGQTIFHQPHKGFTLQIGNGACIAAQTGITTICDFRTMDVALGGQGAPLVPIGDKFLFEEYSYCLNLGGFANISYNDKKGNRLAYDICPVNIVINHLVKERSLSFDAEGSIARQGIVNSALLSDLNNLSFYQQKGPKSLGKEWVLEEMLPVINRYNLPLEDKLRTFYEHVAIQVNNIFVEKTDGEILITGGGAHNNFLIKLFRDLFTVEIEIPSKEVIDYKEALIFAFLGVLRFRNEVNCLASVTGAKHDSIGGVIYQV